MRSILQGGHQRTELRSKRHARGSASNAAGADRGDKSQGHVNDAAGAVAG